MNMTASYASCAETMLSHFVKAFWQTMGTPSYGVEVILPKGVVEIIFSFDDPVTLSLPGKNPSPSTPRCFISGLNDTTLHLHAPTQQNFFGVELKAAGIKKLLNTPAGEFANNITDLEMISKEFERLWHWLAEADSFDTRVEIAQQWMLQKSFSFDEREIAISDFLNTDTEYSGVTKLASQFCYSPRQLNRKTRALFGMSSEAIIAYKRYLQALKLLHNSNETLTSVGYSCNYFDQAHFIREFKKYTGITPGEYRSKKSSQPGHLFQ